MNKHKLYWSLQVGGWLLFALVQILGYILLGNQLLMLPQVLFWFMEAGIFLLFTHLFRNLIVRWGWLDFEMGRLIHRIIFGVLSLAFLIYLARVVISLPLGMYD